MPRGRRKTAFNRGITWFVMLGVVLTFTVLATATLWNSFIVPQLVNLNIIEDEKVKLQPNPEVVGEVEANLPLKFQLLGEYGSYPVSVQLKIYDTQGRDLETLTFPNIGSPVIQTSLSYQSGETLWLYLSVGNMKKTYEFVVPKVKSDYLTLGYNGVHELAVFSVGTYNTVLLDSLGNTIASGSIINSIAKPLEQYSFSVIQQVDGAGYMSSYDFIDGENWNAILVFEVSGTDYDKVFLKNIAYTSPSGANDVMVIERGTKRFYVMVIDDEVISKMKRGNQLVLDGILNVNFEVDAQALANAGGGTAQITIRMLFYGDAQLFQNAGTFGDDVITIFTYTLTYN